MKTNNLQIIAFNALKLLKKPVILTLCFSLTASLSLQAADITWDGAGDDWSLNTNWDGGAVPTSDDDVTLGADGEKVIYLGASNREANYLTFDSATSYTLNLQEKGEENKKQNTQLHLSGGITVAQGNHTIHGLRLGTDVTGTRHQSLYIDANAGNSNAFVFDIAEDASLDLDVRLTVTGKYVVHKRGEGALIISLPQSGNGSLGMSHDWSMAVFEVQEGTLKIATSGGSGNSKNDWSVNGGTLELTADFGAGTNYDHLTIKGSGYKGNGAIHASENLAIITNILYVDDSARINVDAGKTLTIGSNTLITDEPQLPDTHNKHTGIAATGGLVKTGAGTINVTTGTITLDPTGTPKTLHGNHYAGGTLIQAGTILANNTSGSATGSGTVTVDGSDAGLGGTGAIGGELVVSNGWVSAGASGKSSYGQLTINELSIESAGELFVDLQLGNPIAAVAYDQLIISDTVSLDGTLSLNIDDTIVTSWGDESSFYGEMYFLIDNQGGALIDGSFSGLSEGSILSVDGYNFEITYLADADTNSFSGGNDFALRMIPEPSALLLAFLGCLLPLSVRRRR